MTARVDRIMNIGVVGYIAVSVAKVTLDAGDSSVASNILVDIVLSLARGLGG